MRKEEPVSQTAEALLRRFYQQVVNEGRIDPMDEILADDFVEHE